MKAFFLLAGFICGALVGYAAGGLLLVAACVIIVISSRVAIGRIEKRRPIRGMKLLDFWSIFVMFTSGILVTTLRPASTFEPEEGRLYSVKATITERRTLTTTEMYTLDIEEINGKRERGELVLFTPVSRIYAPCDEVNVVTTLRNDNNFRFARRHYIGDTYPMNDLVANSAKNGNTSPGIEKTGERKGLKMLLTGFRDEIKIHIENSMLGDESKGLLKALIIADRSSMDKETVDKFRNSGVIHVLAVSGMHIAIVAGILLFVTSPLALFTGRKIRYVTVIAGVWLFVILTGAALSTVRAGVMLSIASLAWIMERERKAFSATSFALLLILMFRPESMFDAGLQLSYISVASLTLFAERLNPIDHHRHPGIYKGYGLVLSTLIATGATWIVCGFYFGSVALRFLPANIVMLPLLPPYMMAGIIYILFSALGMELSLLGFILEKIPELIYKFLDIVAAKSIAVEVPGHSVALWMGGLILLAVALHSKSGTMAGGSSRYRAVPTSDKRYMAASLLMFVTAIIFIKM